MFQVEKNEGEKVGQKDRSISGVILILLFCIFFVIDITLYIKKDLEHKKYEEKQEQLAVDRQHRAEVQKKYEIEHAKTFEGVVTKKVVENKRFYLYIKHQKKTEKYEVSEKIYNQYQKNEKVKVTAYLDNIRSLKSV